MTGFGIGEKNQWLTRCVPGCLERDKATVLDRGPEVGGLATFHVEGSDPVYLTQALLKQKINVVPGYRNFAVIDFDKKRVAWAIRPYNE